MFKLPSSTTLCLDCTSERTATHNDHHILPILSEYFNNPKFRSFKIGMDNLDRVTAVVASTSLLPRPIPCTGVILSDGDADLNLLFHHISEINDSLDILRRACDMVSLSNLEFLSISFPNPDEVIDWSEIFQQCTEVTTVQLSGHGTIGLLQALTPKEANTREKGGKRKHGDKGTGARAQAANDTDNDEPAPVHVPIFPKLTSPRLQRLDFSDSVPGSGVLYNLVKGAVKRRKANNTPLTTLYIVNCVLWEDQAEALQKFVRHFRWDEREGYDDDVESDR